MPKNSIVMWAGIVLFASLLVPLAGCLVDDSYIHLQYARNLAEAGELSFNRGEPTYGATSPLWVALLSLVYRMGGDLHLWCRVLSWVFGALSILLIYRMALSLAGSSALALAASLMLAAEAWLVRWSAVGMETSFAVFMVLAALAAYRSHARSAAGSLSFGALLFLAFLSRPESLLLVPLAVIVSAWFAPGSVRRRLGWLAVFLPLLALWLILIKGHTGTFLPLTAGAKQGRLVFSPALLRRFAVPLKIMGVTLALPWCAVLAGAARGIISKRSLCFYFDAPPRTDRARSAVLLLAIAWIVALPAVYVLFDFQVLSRYLLPVSPPVILLSVACLGNFTARIGRPSRRSAVVLVFTAAVIAQNVVFYAAVVVPPTRAFSEGMNEVLVGMGTWLHENSRPDAVVASPDIGAVGYVSERRILDLGGLVTPEINRMRQRIPVETIIEDGLYLDRHPDYLVDRHEEAARFAGRIIRGVRFEEVMRGTIQNLGIRKKQPAVYTLYRLDAAPAQGE